MDFYHRGHQPSLIFDELWLASSMSTVALCEGGRTQRKIFRGLGFGNCAVIASDRINGGARRSQQAETASVVAFWAM